MKEVEVKARLRDRATVKQRLTDLGCVFTEPVTQDDRIFIVAGRELASTRTGDNVLRIRQQGNRTIFTLKQQQLNELDCIEKETDVSNSQQLQDIITLLGYEEAMSVRKTRQSTTYDGLTICLDEVVGLGSFIEVEKITDQDAGIVQNELLDFLETLGVKREDRVEQGYDRLMDREKSNSSG